MQRGINREPCFFAEEDYHCYLHWLHKSAADWHCAIHAYVLMTNHVHLLVTSEKTDGIAKLMQAIGRRYVQYINRSYRRTGSLWEGRFKSSVVQAEDYLLTCMRLGSGRFSEIMCAAVGVRRAQRKPGRPVVKRDQSDRVEDQTNFGF